MLLLLLVTQLAKAQEQIQPDLLEPGKPIEKKLVGGETHVYRANLSAGQFLRVTVDRRGTNVVSAILAPDGSRLAELDSVINEASWLESVSAITTVAGSHLIEIKSSNKDAAAGHYEVKIADLRAATERDRTHIAVQQIYAGAARLYKQNNPEARKLAIAKFNEALVLWQNAGSDLEAVAVKRWLASYYVVTDNPREAIGFYRQIAAFWQALGNRKLEAEMLMKVGYSHNALREYQESLNHFTQAITILQSLGDVDSIAQANSGLGIIYNLMGEHQKAIEARSVALQHWRTLGNSRQVFWMLWGLTMSYRNLNNDQKMLEYCEQALAVAREIKDRSLEANALTFLGSTYFVNGNSARTNDYHNQALQIHRETGDKIREADNLFQQANYSMRVFEFGRIMPYMHFWKTQTTKTAQVFALLEQSLALYREMNDPNQVMPLTYLSQYYAANGDRRTALEYCERALRLNEVRPSVSVLCQLAETYAELGEQQKALELHEQGYLITSRDSSVMLEGKANVGYGLAGRLIAAGRLAEAKSLLEESITIKEISRLNLARQDFRTFFTSELANVYERYADLLLQMHSKQLGTGLDVLAFQSSERARARSLLDNLNEARTNLRQDVAPFLLERESALQLKVNSIGGQGTARTEVAPKELDTALEELRRVRAQIRQASPRYAELTQPQPPSLAEIQTELLDADTMLLAYSLGNERSFLWAVTPDSFTTHQLPPRAEIDKAARSLYGLLTIRQRLNGLPLVQQQKQIAEADAQYWEEATALSQMLLAPVAAQLGKKRLLIIAPEALQYLPFAALPEPAISASRQPLLVNHEVITLPSVSVLMFLRREAAGRQAASKSVAVLADPVFATDDPRFRKANPSDRNVARNQAKTPMLMQASAAVLPAELARSLRSFNSAAQPKLPRLLLSRDEANAIIAAAPQRDGLKALDFKASRAVATSSEVSQYRLIHFATHGLLNAEHPELSGLVFSLVDEAGQSQDGFLRLHEIYNLKLHAELVVLSACQTALGKEIKGEGLVGLTRGFMHAGVPRVVASLWRVDDYATSVLMKRFYRGMLQEKMRPAEALRQAQLEMWRQRQWQAPFYWGAFVLQGEWR